MKWIAKKPYLLFWFVIPYLLGIAFFHGGAIDIQLHDTYLVIATWHIGVLQAVLLAVFGLVYWLLRNRKLMPWATVIHVLVTVILAVWLLGNPIPSARHYFSGPASSGILMMDKFILVMAAWGLAQLLFLVNVVVGLVRGRR